MNARRAKQFECVCEPQEWIGRVSSHAEITGDTSGPYHSEWVCSLRAHREDAEASVRKLGFDPIFTRSKVPA